MSQYSDRLAEEQQRFDAEVCVHDLPEIFHYWSNKYLRPFINGFGYDNIEDFFIQEAVRTYRERGTPLTMVSVGAGDCAMETTIASGVVAAGIRDFHMLCLDISNAALERGRERIREAGLEDKFELRNYDFNQGLPEGQFDVVIANQSLHHVVELETLYATIRQQLNPEGCFLVSDMIGRNGHMRWPEAQAVVDEVWEWLPERYRFNWQLQRQEQQFMDWDCSQEGFEGIRAQDVLPLLLEYFSPRVFLAWGNIIDVFIDRGFGHNFHGRTEWDLHFIDRIHAMDTAAIAAGRIKPTHLLAKFQNVPGECLCVPGMTPQTAVREVILDASESEPAESEPPVQVQTESELPAPRPLPLPQGVKDVLRRVPGVLPFYRWLRGLN